MLKKSLFKIGDKIPKQFRNCGSSFGLQFRHIYGRIGEQYIVWNRHSGVICYITRKRGNEWEGFATIRAKDRCEALNARQIGLRHRLLIDRDAIDQTP